jgi:hypothetical protein
LSRVGCGFALVAVPGFWVVVAVGLFAGGTALNGVANESGHFLGAHGRYSEVPDWLYAFMWWVEVVTVTAFFAMMGSFALSSWIGRSCEEEQ